MLLNALMPTVPDYPEVSQIQIKVTLDIFCKYEKSSKYDLQIKKYWVFFFVDGDIFVKFYLMLVYMYPFSNFQFVEGGRGFGDWVYNVSSRKWSIFRFRGWNVVMDFEGGGVRDTSPYFRLTEVGTSVNVHPKVSLFVLCCMFCPHLFPYEHFKHLQLLQTDLTNPLNIL